ncbi:hypothetical protein [Allorhodopirellula solitaria]|nr:hypothetical protein [Allorhodopirellula solitaria]
MIATKVFLPETLAMDMENGLIRANEPFSVRFLIYESMRAMVIRLRHWHSERVCEMSDEVIDA